MQTDDSSERSAELLRLTLPAMTRLGTGCQPISYALWYEYVGEGNAELKQAVDEVVSREGRVSSSVTRTLYDQFVIERAEEVVAKARVSLLELMERIEQSVDSADSRTSGFNSRLNEFGEEISIRPESAAAQVAAMLTDVRELSDSLGSLQSQLDAGRNEVRQLSDELQRMREEVLTDPLTELMNRRGLERTLAQAWESPRRDSSLALIMFDIDHFKKVNDTYGHMFGDKVIQGVASAIRAAIRERDCAARFGGEEFAVVVWEGRPGTADAVAERVRSLVEQSRIRKTDGESIGNLTLSAGVARRRDGEGSHTLIERADRALYRSKAAGRNRVTVAP